MSTEPIVDTGPGGRPDRAGGRPNLRLATVGPDDTRALARALAAVLVDGDLLVLDGDLGAGKTCFTQGLGAGLGVTDPITSPTFALANRYRGRVTLHHLDAYRLEGEADTLDLELDDLLETGITVVEWGNRIAGALPADRFTITFSYPELDPAGRDGGDDPDHDQELDADLDRRIIVIDGPVGERDLGSVLARWVVSG